jgi:hypothetical protein
MELARKRPPCIMSPNYCSQLWNQKFAGLLKDGKDVLYSNTTIEMTNVCDDAEHCTLEVGDEVIMIYWPRGIESNRVCTGPDGKCAPLTTTTTAITFKGQDLYLRDVIMRTMNAPTGLMSISISSKSRYIPSSVLYGNWTFTWPTIYMAHHPMFAISTSYGRIGGPAPIDMSRQFTWVGSTLRTAGIIPLERDHLSSIAPIAANRRLGDQYPKLVAQGVFQQDPWPDNDPMFEINIDKGRREKFSEVVYPNELESINFKNFENPVPASVYYDARVGDCWGKQSHCGTITDDSYRPSLAIKEKVWLSLLPKHYKCGRPMLVDPPISLLLVATSALPAPTVRTYSPAKPGGMATPPASAPTPDIPGPGRQGAAPWGIPKYPTDNRNNPPKPTSLNREPPYPWGYSPANHDPNNPANYNPNNPTNHDLNDPANYHFNFPTNQDRNDPNMNAESVGNDRQPHGGTSQNGGSSPAGFGIWEWLSDQVRGLHRGRHSSNPENSSAGWKPGWTSSGGSSPVGFQGAADGHDVKWWPLSCGILVSLLVLY